MNLKSIALFLPFILLYLTTAAQNGRPVNLRSEYLTNPLGIDARQPRLSWQLQDTRQGAVQRAYQLWLGTDSLAVLKQQTALWNSGRLERAEQLVVYNGQALKPLTRYFWKVTLWDKDNKAHSSPVAAFETGLLGQHWQGTWISDAQDINQRKAPYFRKEFTLKKKLKYARAYVAAAGLYEFSINGKRIGDHRLDPMYTRYDRRNLYVTYDVTAQLQQGGNALGMLLGNGWYNHQALAVWNFHNAPWRGRPAFCLDLRLVYTDGSEETITSGLGWKTGSGPLIYNNIYTGEHYDARLEQPGWDLPGFDDSKWSNIRLRGTPSQQIVAQQTVPIRLTKTFNPRSFKKLDEHTYLFDMGQNMAGVTRIRVKGNAGTLVQIKHGERLLPNGRIDLSNIDVYYRGDKEAEPFQTDRLILSGTKEDEFMARFNYKGFRYVEVSSSAPIVLTENSVTAFFMHSDVPATGQLHTSSTLVNRLWEVTNNAYLSNLMGYPTDCPQREKNGWTGDAHLAIETAFYNYEGITVYEKWLADHRDEQQPNGVLPDIIPTGGWGYGTANGLDWTSTIAIIPWQAYIFYGDIRPLRENYENIKRYVDYVNRISPEGLTTFGRGDWVPVKTTSNLELTSSVYFYADARILARTAKLLGYPADAQHYEALSQKIKAAINGKFLNAETGVYANGSQTELSVPLYWDVVPTALKAKVAANLNKSVVASNYHLDVGVLGAKALLNALSENGYGESAYKVAVQDSYPSWGWWVVNGATTLLENWDLQAKRDISDNHMMFGEIGGWFFKSIGGILPDANAPGFKHIHLRPLFPESLQESAVQHQSPYGLIKSSWKKQGKTVLFTVVIPPNSTATFYPPVNAVQQQAVKLTAGKHQLTVLLK